jgi:hypothetical protein
MAPQVQGQRKASPHLLQAFGKALGDFPEQEIISGNPAGCAVAAPAQQGTIEDPYVIYVT